NKLGIENTLLFDGANGVRLNDLPPSTEAYFRKLPGHDTLRMILSDRTILVEGPSDELVVQKAFLQLHGRMPLEAGVEAISVNSPGFKRFLDIGLLLKVRVAIVTDNDGKTSSKRKNYEAYAAENISICIGEDDAYPTLEPQLLKVNGRDK